MSFNTAKTWCIRLIPVVLFFVSYYFSQFFLQSYGGTTKIPVPSKNLCGSWLVSRRWESLNFNITRKTRLFLTLGDFFWQQHKSALPLPYGIKGSESFLLKVLAITSNYDMPASIENLDCRTCVVIGNGFSIKNSSLGAAINKYDVVISIHEGEP
ncbi:hypothetical protein ANANG_G00236430 [Anguilla anguilla]|uniref:ST3 beta-galactoside alpha-2,3-sialyltransferase 1 n=1 Tax=Anguilla anguilla TaxID=7936 RepID=A0A9D3LUD1_ANGAN|nr:hypothetical protein ANANG_G00236430 [Anguilla anguilla]